MDCISAAGNAALSCMKLGVLHTYVSAGADIACCCSYGLGLCGCTNIMPVTLVYHIRCNVLVLSDGESRP